MTVIFKRGKTDYHWTIIQCTVIKIFGFVMDDPIVSIDYSEPELIEREVIEDLICGKIVLE